MCLDKQEVLALIELLVIYTRFTHIVMVVVWEKIVYFTERVKQKGKRISRQSKSLSISLSLPNLGIKPNVITRLSEYKHKSDGSRVKANRTQITSRNGTKITATNKLHLSLCSHLSIYLSDFQLRCFSKNKQPQSGLLISRLPLSLSSFLPPIQTLEPPSFIICKNL